VVASGGESIDSGRVAAFVARPGSDLLPSPGVLMRSADARLIATVKRFGAHQGLDRQRSAQAP